MTLEEVLFSVLGKETRAEDEDEDARGELLCSVAQQELITQIYVSV